MPTLISKKKNNEKFYEIRICMNGQRKCIYLGSRPDANFVFEMVSAIDKCRKIQSPMPGYVTAWIEQSDEKLSKRMQEIGLIEKQVRLNAITISELYDKWFEYPVVRKENTYINNRTAYKRVLDFFNPDTIVGDITEEDALRFKMFLTAKKYSPATISGIFRKVNGWFSLGIRLGLLTVNPFINVKTSGTVNESRRFYVKAEWLPKLLDACPDQNWRTFLTLARIGGLRVDSETSILTWDDVDFENNLLTIHSPKTERYPGKDKRIIPLFPELRRELLKTEKDSVLVLNGKCGRVNAKNYMEKIIYKAGLPLWEKTFQNMRSSREMDLLEAFPAHVVSAWMGHSIQTERKHYVYAREEDYLKGATFTK